MVSLYSAYLLHETRIRFHSKALARGLGVSLLAFGLMMFHFDYAQSYYEGSLDGDMQAARRAVELDPQMRLYRLHKLYLEKGLPGLRLMDPTIDRKTNLKLFALVNYGRPW
jgi:hypothetical protein